MNLSTYAPEDLIRKRKSLRRELGGAGGLQSVRIAVLGGSTTSELVDLLELHLLASGFRPEFHQSEYGRYYEDAVLDPAAIAAFQPDIVYLHTCFLNAQHVPPADGNEEKLAASVQEELARWRQIWTSLEQHTSAQIIQNNFELPAHAILGNLDVSSSGGQTRFLTELNVEFARAATADARLLLQDVCSISAMAGLSRWFDWDRYFSYKILTTPEGSNALAQSLAAMVRALYGRSKKVLVLDLDNTLWGGVIGDDGVDRICIGRETPVAEAYTAFQEYCLSLLRRGVVLAVCSKNNEETAREGFQHPDSVLKLEHISCFKANWEPKHENLLAIAQELNLGLDSFVFVDDNPAERAIVAAQLPAVAVPDVGSDVSRFAEVIQAGRYFEAVAISAEDVARAAAYQANSERTTMMAQFANYGEYLASLEMVAEIERFKPVYIERIAQLTNKTNQFNLTTRRYTLAEMEAIQQNPASIGLYGRLTDRFGDNGLISVVLGRKEGSDLHLDLWLMSCRVLKRDMESAMLDVLVEEAKQAGVSRLVGYYMPTKKNGMVAEHYRLLGFTLEQEDPQTGDTIWSMEVASYSPRCRHIQRLRE